MGWAPWERALIDLLKGNFAPDILNLMAKHCDLSELAHHAILEIHAWPPKKKST
jgi:hypothetical protein